MVSAGCRPGYAPAQYNMGMMYVTGKGIPVDNEAALKWYLLAAIQGDVAAQYNVGAMYVNARVRRSTT